MQASEIQVVVNGATTTLQMAINDILADVELIKNSMADVSLTAANMDAQLGNALATIDQAVSDAQEAANQNGMTVEGLNVAIEEMRLAVTDVQQVSEQHGTDISELSSSLQGIDVRVTNLELI